MECSILFTKEEVCLFVCLFYCLIIFIYFICLNHINRTANQNKSLNR